MIKKWLASNWHCAKRLKGWKWHVQKCDNYWECCKIKVMSETWASYVPLTLLIKSNMLNKEADVTNNFWIVIVTERKKERIFDFKIGKFPIQLHRLTKNDKKGFVLKCGNNCEWCKIKITGESFASCIVLTLVLKLNLFKPTNELLNKV